MNFIKKHPQEVVCVLVVLLCAALYFWDASATQTDSSTTVIQREHQDLQVIQGALTNSKPTPQYRYGPAAVEHLNEAENEHTAFAATAEQAPEVAQFVAYPRPERPKVDQVPFSDNQNKIELQQACFDAVSDLRTETDHDGIFIGFNLPLKTLKFMQLVRAELYRGEAADKINTNQPYGVIQFNPEEPLDLSKAAEAEKNNLNTPSQSTDIGTRRHQTAPAPEGPKIPAKVTAPAQISELQVFGDTNAQQKKTYYYQVRLIGRMTKAPNSREPFITKDKEEKEYLYLAPVGATPVAPHNPGAKIFLFASPLSPVVKDTPPANYDIRFSGIIGSISPPETPDFKIKHDYKGRFAVRVWLLEIQRFATTSIIVGEGEPLAGSLRYALDETGSGPKKKYDFNTGLKLKEIKWGSTTITKEIEKPVMGANGVQETDANGLPKVTKQTVTMENPLEVAWLEDAKGHAEAYPLTHETTAEGGPTANNFRDIWEKQQKERKKAEEEQDRVRELIKKAQENAPDTSVPGANPAAPVPAAPALPQGTVPAP